MAEGADSRRSTASAARAALVLACAVTVFGCDGGTGTMSMSEDEPPIRVRGGSIVIDLLGGGEFEEHGPRDKKNWKIVGDPPRERSNYTVAIVSSAETCPSRIVTDVPKVTVTYSDGQWVQFAAAGNGTKITTMNAIDHEVPAERRRLRYGAEGYIQNIDVGSPCTFSAADPNLRVYLLD